MNKLKKLLSILLVVCLICSNLRGVTVNAQQKTINISNLSSWEGVTNYMPDSIVDAGGGGYELTKFYVTNDASYIYMRWDIQLSGQNVTDMVSTNLGASFSCSSDGSTADAMAWLLFDNKGTVTASLERLTGTEQSVSIDSSEVKRFNTGSENALISVVTRVPFTAFATIGFADYIASDKMFPLWCQTNASSSLTANIKDRIPDSGYFSYDAASGNAAIVGAGLSSAKDFLAFSVLGQTSSTVIDSSNHTISVQMPAETSLTSLQPTFTLSDMSKGTYVNNVPQSSGTSSQDFTQPVIYTVVAEDSSTQDWQVTITSTPDAPANTPAAPIDTPAESTDSLSVHDISYTPDGSEQIIDSNLTIIASDNITGAKVYIEQNFNSTKDSIVYNPADVPSGLSVVYDSANGVLTISGTATADVYQTFLRTLKFSTTDTSGTKSINYLLGKSENDVMYCSDTGHFYEYVPYSALDDTSWTTAKASAEQRIYNGLTGYLATITSVAENEFVTSKCGGAGWLGASDLGSITGDIDGIWKWVTGPETGARFYDFNSHTVLDAKYNNWASGEPNNSGGEYFLHIMSAEGGDRPIWANYTDYPAGSWNDYSEVAPYGSIYGYIVEYGDDYISLDSSSGLTGVANITVAANTIIEPQLTINVTGNPTDWVPAANLNINTTVDSSGLKSVTVNGIDITSSYTDGYTVSQNGTYTFVVTSNSGLTATQTVDVTKIDSTTPNNAVIIDAGNYTADKWYKTNQTVTASFAPTAGSTERLQYSLDGGNTWADGSSVEVTTEGITAVKFRIIDEQGNISEVQTSTVQIDKTAPVNAKIIAKGNEFTSFLNQITFGLFFKDTVNVSITAEDSTSGIKTIEYQKVEDESAYDENGTWTNGASFSVIPDDKFIVYARITDNAGNSTIINTNGIITDSTVPQLALSDVSGWNMSDVSVGVTVGDSFAGAKEVTYTTDEAVPQTGTVSITNGTGTITLTNEGKYKLTVTAKDNSGNTVTKTADIQLDKTQPNNLVITDADNYTADKWYKTNQTVAATFTPTAGSTEKLQYSLDGGNTWTDGSSVEVTAEGITAVKFRIIDELGNISAVKTATVQIDKTAPTAPEVDQIDSSTTKITGTAEVGTTIAVKNASGNVLGETTVGVDGVFSISIESQEADTDLYVTSTDVAGNISNAVTLTVKTIDNDVSAMIDALPDPITASDSEIIDAQEDITDTKKHYDALDEAGRKAISTARKEKLNKLTDRLNALLVIIPKDKVTGITASGIGTAVIIPELNDSSVEKVKISLEVNPIITESAADIPTNIEIASNTLHTDGREILEVYDISLIKSIYGVTGSLVSKAKVNNTNIVDYITIRVPVPAGYEGRKDLGVIYINDNGIITPLKSKVITSNGKQYIEFQTNHFSNYAIVKTTTTSTAAATTPLTNPKTGDATPFTELYTLFGFSGATMFILIRKRKKCSSSNF